MASTPFKPQSAWQEFRRGLAVQLNVIGALVMRELHTRYGRENIGYLWVIGEPLTLASAIALLHSGESSHYAGDMRPVPFAVLGYCVFITFRGIFNRAEGSIEVNAPLMYHRMVTIFDIMLARAILELAGTFLSLMILISLLVAFGLADVPYRPLYLLVAVCYMFWISFALSLVVVAGTHDRKTLGRFVHPLTYILMPLSGAFYIAEWVPPPYRDYVLAIPLLHVFEIARYGMFRSASDEYYSFGYLTACCMVFTYIGLVMIKLLRQRIHLH